jgi:hypothetical protein
VNDPLVDSPSFWTPECQANPTFIRVDAYHVRSTAILAYKHNKFWCNSINFKNSILAYYTFRSVFHAFPYEPFAFQATFSLHDLIPNYLTQTSSDVGEVYDSLIFVPLYVGFVSCLPSGFLTSSAVIFLHHYSTKTDNIGN